MNNLYQAYSTIINGFDVPFQEEIKRTTGQFEKVLLPILQAEGKSLSDVCVLEFGSGWGKNLLALKALGGRELHGVDISEEQINLGKTLGLENYYLIKPDEDLGQLFGDIKFDIIMAIDILEHLSIHQLEKFSEVVKTLLRPGALLVVEVPNDLAPLNPIRSGDLTHLRAFTGASVSQFFRLCNLEPRLIRGLEFPGSGLKYRLRITMAHWVIGPLVVFFSRILYGRADSFGIFEPNIFAVGKRSGES